MWGDYARLIPAPGVKLRPMPIVDGGSLAEARALYRRYREGFGSAAGSPTPPWDELPEDEQLRWGGVYVEAVAMVLMQYGFAVGAAPPHRRRKRSP